MSYKYNDQFFEAAVIYPTPAVEAMLVYITYYVIISQRSIYAGSQDLFFSFKEDTKSNTNDDHHEFNYHLFEQTERELLSLFISTRTLL